MSSLSNQAFSAGSARQPAASARSRRVMGSLPAGQAWMSASSNSAAVATSACVLAMLTAIARRVPVSGSSGPVSA